MFDGLRVLEISTGLAPAYVGRLWTDLGAEVIAAEPPGGSPVRSEGPFRAGGEGAAYGGLYAYLGAGKQHVTLDLQSDAGQGLFERLAAQVDIVVQEVEGPAVESMRPLYARLHEANPALIMTVISPFGLSGPRRYWRATPLTLFAMTSRMRLHGSPDRHPLQYGQDTVPFQVGATAAAATAIAMLSRDESGEGRFVEVAGIEALIANVDVVTMLTSFTGVLNLRGLYASMAYPCADGVVQLSFRDTDIKGIAAAMGVPELADDPRFMDRETFTQHKPEFEPMLLTWLLEHTRDEIFTALQARNVMCAPVFDFLDVLSNPQYAARQFLRTFDDPELGAVTLPGTPFLRRGTAVPGLPPASPGADNGAVFGRLLGLGPSELDAPASAVVH